MRNTVGPSRRRRLVDHVRQVLGVSEREACAVIGQPRTTQRREMSCSTVRSFAH